MKSLNFFFKMLKAYHTFDDCRSEQVVKNYVSEIYEGELQ